MDRYGDNCHVSITYEEAEALDGCWGGSAEYMKRLGDYSLKVKKVWVVDFEPDGSSSYRMSEMCPRLEFFSQGRVFATEEGAKNRSLYSGITIFRRNL